MIRWALRADEHGIMPMAGGGYDQSQSFLDAWDFIGGELARWRVKLGLK